MKTTEIPLPPNLLTAGQLARNIKRTREGVKKAIVRLHMIPMTELGGVSYYHPDSEMELMEAMRGPNLSTLQD